MFVSPWFAIAGLVAAAGPIIIHLLNRQRFRVVEWAAMDFLRQAVRRSRRILRLRDLLLLALRTLCVLAFGLAMARPYLTPKPGLTDPDQPVHAILLVDNSLSMSAEQLGKPLLDEVKIKAKDVTGRLPPGSRISVLPVCSTSGEYNPGAYSTREDALEALAAIQPLDRVGTAAEAINRALACLRRVSSPQAKQVAYLSDQQAINWPAQSLEAHFRQLPCPLEIIQVAAHDLENAWIEDFRLQDGIADPASPAVFLAQVRYQGIRPRENVQVTLAIEGVTVATQVVDLQPGQVREVRFPPYQFEVSPEPGKPTFVPAEVALPPGDALRGDDRRFLMVPVVAALPVVFIDQYGPDEEPARNRFGETIRLRRLLAPITDRQQPERQLVQVIHKKMEQVDQELLSNARLVVIAGATSPEGKVPLLRQYVEQGGRLLIAAGGEFDAGAWTQSAWLDGLGILPAPLKPAPVGRLPGAGAGPLTPFQLDFTSMEHHHYFLLEQASREEMEDLYRLPYFFMAVDADLGDDVLKQMGEKVAEEIDKQRSALGDNQKRLDELNELARKGDLSEAQRQERDRLEQLRAGLRPHWLTWANGEQAEGEDSVAVDKLVERTRPRVIARFTNKVPYMIERNIGAGQVLFVSSGVYRDWNTVTATNAVVMFDRILRDMLEKTLPRRNLTTSDRLVLPVPPGQHRARFTLTDPAGKESPLAVDVLGSNRYGLSVVNLPHRGSYRVTAHGTKEMTQTSEAKLWQVAVAVNGPPEESDLKALDKTALAERIELARSVQFAGMLEGRDLWEWLLIAVICGLVLEMALLALPAMGREPAA